MAINSPLTALVVFRLDDQRYALPLVAVERVIPAVEITPLPGAPAVVLGVINVAGEIVPVFNLRRRFGLAARALAPADQFLLVQRGPRSIAVVVDEALTVIESPVDEIVRTAPLVPGVGQVNGLLRLPDGLVLLHDLEKLLSWSEAQELETALTQELTHGA